jgi:hypothetical protein
MTTLPPEHQSRLDRELDEGEAINWVAQPMYSMLKKQSVANWFIFALIGFLFGALFITLGVVEHLYPDPVQDRSVFGPIIFGSIVIVVALLTMPLFLISAKRTACNTIYALTDKRAIIITVHRDGSITERDYRGDELIHLARKEYKDGSGTLTFESARGAGHTSQTASRHRFQAIERVIEVERMLRDQFGAC